MAFPASPSNNQVHKESGQNRAWVYDSATGTWDQVRETDRTEINTDAAAGSLRSGITFPAGHVVKIYSKTYTSSHALGISGTWTTIGLSDSNNLDITMDTPASSRSKYWIQCNVYFSNIVGGAFDFRLLDSGTNYIIRHDACGSRNRSFMGVGHWTTGEGSQYSIREVSGSYLWSPGSASAERVQLQGTNLAGGDQQYVNRSTNDSNANWQSRSCSSMTVMEIAG